MTSVLSDFEISNKINEFVRNTIIRFFIFDDDMGSDKNIIYITNNDNVFGFGTNYNGVLGLGHSKRIDEPVQIDELCGKGITQFYNDHRHLLAHNQDLSIIYAWGSNEHGQQGFGNQSKKLFRPHPLDFGPDNKNIAQIVCGLFHNIALTKDGRLYQWGATYVSNIFYYKTTIPTIIDFKLEDKLTKIYCAGYSSFALTDKGNVFTWGINFNHVLTDNGVSESELLIPRALEIENIKTILVNRSNAYFLNEVGHIYILGENLKRDIKFKPVLLDTTSKFDDIIEINHTYGCTALAIKDRQLFKLEPNSITKLDANFCSFDKYYAKTFQITLKTVNLMNNWFINSIIQKSALVNFQDQRIHDNCRRSFRINVQFYYAFDDNDGGNLLLITDQDEVYGMGSNMWGMTGAGHMKPVLSPQFIPELSYKNISNFYNGYNFVLATNTDNNKLYGWGCNTYGQLAQGHISDKYLKPKQIDFFNGMTFKKICCGDNHILVMNSDQLVFGWGANDCGQVTMGKKTSPEDLCLPILLSMPENTKTIYCSTNNSFALTIDGRVYSWGWTMGEAFGETLKSRRPHLIDLFDIDQLASTYYYSYLLNKDGLIYFYGGHIDLEDLDDQDQSIESVSDTSNWEGVTNEAQISNMTEEEIEDFENNRAQLEEELFLRLDESGLIDSQLKETIENEIEFEPGAVGKIYEIPNETDLSYGIMNHDDFYQSQIKQITPKLLDVKFGETPVKFSAIYYLANWVKCEVIASAQSTDGSIYLLNEKNFFKTDYKNVEEFYREKYQLTYQTKRIKINAIESIAETIGQNKDSIYFSEQNVFRQLGHLGGGGFGQVFKMENILTKKQYAFKRIEFPANQPELAEKTMKELKIMKSLHDHFVVQYFNHWIINDYLYIQMELCSDNLQNILQIKPAIFRRKPGNTLGLIEYYISSEIFKDLLMCLSYLHEYKPAIIHRDIKPQNILIAIKPMNGYFFKLCDFGLATHHPNQSMSHTVNVGTPSYQAPEVLSGNSYDIRADIYSMSLVASELFDINVQDSIEGNYESQELAQKYKKLSETLILMQMTPKWEKRPKCNEILNNCNKWSVDSQLIINGEIEDWLQILANHKQKFFIEYFEYKLGDRITNIN